MIRNSCHGNNDDVETCRYISGPAECVNADLMSTLLAILCNAEEIPLQSAIRKILIKTKRQFQNVPSFAAITRDNLSNTISAVMSR